jgi:CheY-like chemotaxis protein
LQQSSAQHQEFDLMLLDWRMPGTDGLALLRQAYVTPGIGLPLVLLMVPAFELEQAVAASDDLVLDGMLSKPITPDSLREAVTRAYSGELQYILPPPGKSDRRLSSLRLLVAEDNELNQEVIEQTLRRAGAEVVIARDGQAAVNALKIPGVRFDAVLMDIQMPVMDGYEATRVIRHELGRLDLPIIALTTLASPQSRQKSRLAGMVGHLVKPLNVDDLLDLLVRERHRQSDTQQQARARQPDGIDLSSALQAFGGDAPKYREMMRKFVERHAQDASRGHELLGAQDLETLTGLVHGLRGVASLLYATEVARLAGAAENALLSGQHERLTALLDELQKALDTLAESVDQL